MGIGNTTTSSAVISVLTGLDPETVTGKGAGLDNAGLKRKIEVIKEGIRIHRPGFVRWDRCFIKSRRTGSGSTGRFLPWLCLLADPGSPGRSYYRCGGTGSSKDMSGGSRLSAGIPHICGTGRTGSFILSWLKGCDPGWNVSGGRNRGSCVLSYAGYGPYCLQQNGYLPGYKGKTILPF